jgi:integrase
MSRKRRGRHEGTVRKRADGRYEARLEIGVGSDGRRVQDSFYGTTKQEALEKLNAAKGLPRAKRAGRLTLGEYLATWLAEVQQRCKFATYKQREGIIRKHINPYIGGLRLTSLRTEQITGLLNALRRAGTGQRTVQLAYVVLHAALAVAVRLGLITSNPSDACPKPKVPRKPNTIWTKEQAQSFLNAVRETDYYALFLLAITTGMRQGELFGLQWEHVNLEGGFLSVVYALCEGPVGPVLTEPKTRSSVRRVDLPNIVVSALKALGPKQTGFVFQSADGRPIRKSNFIRRAFHPLLKTAGVPRIRFHDLRHTANTLLLLDGVSPNVVAERMGHSTTRMTLDTYGHVMAGSQRIAADKLDRLFAPSLEFGGQMVVKEATIATDLPGQRKQKFNVIRALSMVEMRGLEPLTPCLQSRCSTS